MAPQATGKSVQAVSPEHRAMNTAGRNRPYAWLWHCYTLFVFRQSAALFDPLVKPVDHLTRGDPDTQIIIRHIEHLIAQPVGFQAAINHMPQIACIDIGEYIAAAGCGIGDEGREVVAYSCGSMTLLIRNP